MTTARDQPSSRQSGGRRLAAALALSVALVWPCAFASAHVPPHHTLYPDRYLPAPRAHISVTKITVNWLGQCSDGHNVAREFEVAAACHHAHASCVLPDGYHCSNDLFPGHEGHMLCRRSDTEIGLSWIRLPPGARPA